MMIAYSKKNRPSRFLIIGLVVVLLFLALNVFSSSIRNFFYCLTSPLQGALWGGGQTVSNFFSPLFALSALKNENIQLSLENHGLLARVEELKDVKQENQALRIALKTGLSSGFNLSLARIIEKDPSDEAILIDKGARDGISVGAAVINEQRVLYGTVSDVYANYSKVLLLNHESFISDIKIQDKDILGIVKGRGGSMRLELIPQEADLQERDVLLTSGFKGLYPANLLIGRAMAPEKEDTKSFQETNVDLFMDLSSVNSLFVLLK
ncbi:rod shape-determining protein MreC [Patescibacteria group bacterium]|nr:rod shape-determining protein MreC [Patescibacteria group bacterium]